MTSHPPLLKYGQLLSTVMVLLTLQIGGTAINKQTEEVCSSLSSTEWWANLLYCLCFCRCCSLPVAPAAAAAAAAATQTRWRLPDEDEDKHHLEDILFYCISYILKYTVGPTSVKQIFYWLCVALNDLINKLKTEIRLTFHFRRFLKTIRIIVREDVAKYGCHCG